ncbi:MAG TPA: iron-sulfur cluster insertion protein ErpA [Chloroflexi bacterium]|nr:iron-sulfur cluster insertion protein ErpA [Chloroflexota bacterium]HBY06472.1 iron-sulfur cluster insertion protein ErpA [Chloroflexota bacterium]
MLAEQTQIETIALTPAAANAVQDLLAKRELEGYALRVYIKGGGCSGYQYGMALDNNFREQDLVTDCFGVKVVVDEVSIDYMRGATIDFVEDVMGSGFKVENPNAVSSCGCGSSFRTQDGDASQEGGSCSSCH